MFAPSRSKALEKAISSNAVTLPGFLVPAFQASPPRRQFSNTSSRASKLGRTPISIPPGVEISIGEPKAKKDATTYLRILKRTVTVTGPLGKLNLEIPPFLTIDHDEAAKKALLSIENTELKEQKEMWGTYG
jgi:large subunit ribosomal protein L6